MFFITKIGIMSAVNSWRISHKLNLDMEKNIRKKLVCQVSQKNVIYDEKFWHVSVHQATKVCLYRNYTGNFPLNTYWFITRSFRIFF